MKEWNAIDLHMHTVSGITRDKSRDTVVFNYALLNNVLNEYKLKLMAVTNHNIIDMVNYILMRHIAKFHKANILIGVELDTNLMSGAPIHIATIFEENFSKNYEAMMEIKALVDVKRESSCISFNPDEIIGLVGKYDAIMIPHGNKDKGIFKDVGEEQIQEALKKIREGFIRIFDSPSDWKLSEVKKFLCEINEENLDEFGGVLFSDVRDWSKYHEKYRNFYMNAAPTFKGLVHSITNPTQRFKKFDEIRENKNYIQKIVFRAINDRSRIESGEIELSSGYNCIIGKSGSGKSLLLHLIKKKLMRDYLGKEQYRFSENTEIEIYNEDGRLLDANSINLGIGADLYKKIIAASASEDNSDYYSIIKLLNNTFEKEEKFKKFKQEYIENIREYTRLNDEIGKAKENLITDFNKLSNDIKKYHELEETKLFDVKTITSEYNELYKKEEINEFQKYKWEVSNLQENTKKYVGKYKEILINKLSEMDKIMNLVILDMTVEYQNGELIKNKIRIINEAIEKINSLKSSKVKEKAKLFKEIPKDIKSIVNSILELHLKIIKSNSIDLSIKKEKINSEKELNRNILIIESLPNEMLTNVNEKNNLIFNTSRKKTCLNEFNRYDMTDRIQARKLIDKYIQVGVISQSREVFSDSLKVSVQIKFDGQDIKEINPGDIAKKYIEIYFEEQVYNDTNTVVLFDQIENDVDKTFINEVIRKLIGNTKGRVQLIVVTHDPIVAVNADPNNYIETKKSEKNKIIYRNFVAESYERDELETIAANVDGSKEVIKGRYEIYEGDRLHGN